MRAGRDVGLRLALAALTLCPLAACASSAPTSAASPSPAARVEYLFVIDGSRPVVTSEPDGSCSITLSDVAADVLWFTDRPLRRAGRLPLDGFLANWSRGPDSFESNPPNASLLLTDDAGGERHAVVELDNPALDERSLSFRCRKLEGDLDMPDASRAVLFVDDGGVTFHDIAADPEAGISYTGAPSATEP